MMNYSFFTSKEIKPQGWLKRQLEIQAASLSGNLDKMWNDIRESKWIGGTAEGWERVPYWLDGFIPLAYLLENEDMISRAKKYIDAIISFQKPDGWICPCSRRGRPRWKRWPLSITRRSTQARWPIIWWRCCSVTESSAATTVTSTAEPPIPTP